MHKGSLRLANTPVKSFLRNTVVLFNVMSSGCSLIHADFSFVLSSVPNKLMRAQQMFRNVLQT
jgi:hypothetical protein